MPEIVSGAEYATFINTFRCEPSNQDEVVQLNIDIVDRVASTFSGFISAAVHRSADGTRVFNYLQCESAEHLAEMQRSPEFQAIARWPGGGEEVDPRKNMRRPRSSCSSCGGAGRLARRVDIGRAQADDCRGAFSAGPCASFVKGRATAPPQRMEDPSWIRNGH